jgi:bifunctional enzyme CysN/CysC
MVASTLRVLTCGSVDDGKSTLIGRLLYETSAVYDDHLATLDADSRRIGTQGESLDFALLVDGLAAEREQGITIDVAYRYLRTANRVFVIADSPGHEQYTRNMVTAASTADVAVLLVDARKGLLTQTRRHAHVVALLGVPQVVLAVNKLDLVDNPQAVFASIATEFEAFASEVAFAGCMAIPMSALRGDNVTSASQEFNWYTGPTLLLHLESIDVATNAQSAARFVVQSANRPSADFRGCAGIVVGGSLRPGDAVRVLPSGVETSIDRLVTFTGDLDEACVGESVTVCLVDEVDAGRGSVLVDPAHPASMADQFEVSLVWMGDQPMLPGRPYLLKLGATSVGAVFEQPKYQLDVNSREHLAARTLELNQIGVCNVALDRVVPFDPYVQNRDMGGFIVIDRGTFDTIGAGTIHFALRRADNVHWQVIEVDRRAHADLKRQQPLVVWFTGLSGAGKSTVANAVERILHAQGRHTYLLDGDNLRHGLNRDLGFTPADRVENVRRTIEVAHLMHDAGLIVLVSLISPYRNERARARELIGDDFIEVFVDAPIDVAEQRDPKGLYAKARRGALPNFTGIDAPYEPPEHADVVLPTAELSVDQAAQLVVRAIEARQS